MFVCLCVRSFLCLFVFVSLCLCVSSFLCLLLDFEFFDSGLTDGADVSHVPEVLVEVEGVADHELVRDLERDVVRGVAVTL